MSSSATKELFTATLDDKKSVFILLQRYSGIKSFHFEEPEDLLAAIDKGFEPAAIFVDIHLNNGKLGTATVPEIRARMPHVPIIVVTSDEDVARIQESFDAGATDFILKPFKAIEVKCRLEQRVTEAMRHMETEVILFGDIQVNTRNRRLYGPLGATPVSALELSFFTLLAKYQGEVVSRSLLRKDCWQVNKVSDKAVTRKVNTMRELLSRVSRNVEIEMRYGEGYYFTFKDQQNLKVG